MEFPKRLYVVKDGYEMDHQHHLAEEEFGNIPSALLDDGAEVAIYRFVRTKKVQVTRRLVSVNPGEPDQEEPDEPAEGADVTPEPIVVSV